MWNCSLKEIRCEDVQCIVLGNERMQNEECATGTDYSNPFNILT
jgi:hypothetical protein